MERKCSLCLALQHNLKILEDAKEVNIPLADEVIVKEPILFIHCRIDRNFLGVVFSNYRGILLDRDLVNLFLGLATPDDQEKMADNAECPRSLVVNRNDLPTEFIQAIDKLDSANCGYLVTTLEHRPSFNKDEIQLMQDMMERVGNDCVSSVCIDHAYRLYLPESGDTKSPFQPA